MAFLHAEPNTRANHLLKLDHTIDIVKRLIAERVDKNAVRTVRTLALCQQSDMCILPQTLAPDHSRRGLSRGTLSEDGGRGSHKE